MLHMSYLTWRNLHYSPGCLPDAYLQYSIVLTIPMHCAVSVLWTTDFTHQGLNIMLSIHSRSCGKHLEYEVHNHWHNGIVYHMKTDVAMWPDRLLQEWSHFCGFFRVLFTQTNQPFVSQTYWIGYYGLAFCRSTAQPASSFAKWLNQNTTQHPRPPPVSPLQWLNQNTTQLSPAPPVAKNTTQLSPAPSPVAKPEYYPTLPGPLSIWHTNNVQPGDNWGYTQFTTSSAYM